MQKYLLWKSSSFLGIFILNSYSEKIAVPKSNCRKELPILKKWLLCRIFAPKKKLFWKNNSCEKRTFLKKEKTTAVLKKQLRRKSNCCVEVVTLKKCEGVASARIEFSWISGNICEKGNRYLKKRNQTGLAITLIIFSKRFPHPYKYSWRISYEYLPGWLEPTEKEIIRLCLYHTIFHKF